MPGRSYNPTAYKYGFNGKEKDDELKGPSNSYDFGARIYDSRIGRWLSLDPLMKKYTGLSPYKFVANDPISNIDIDGRDIKPLTSNDISKINSVLNTYNDLFVVQKYKHSVDVGQADGLQASHNVFTTGTTRARFETQLAKSGLSDEEKKEATAVFDVLSSDDIVEIGIVKQADFTAVGDNTPSSTNNEFVGSSNNNLKTLLSTPDKTADTIDKSLSKEKNNGTNSDASKFGFYPEPGASQSTTPNGGEFKGTLIVAPAEGSTPAQQENA